MVCEGCVSVEVRLIKNYLRATAMYSSFSIKYLELGRKKLSCLKVQIYINLDN